MVPTSTRIRRPTDRPAPAAEEAVFFRQVLDTLTASIAVLDVAGRIIWTNRTWCDFAAANDHPCPGRWSGTDYLDVCDRATGEGADDAYAAAAGIRAVIAGERDHFYHDYPCHRPDTPRWFQLRVGRFEDAGELRVVVSHENVTERKLAELAHQHAAEHDQLTGLGNRALLMRRLQAVLETDRPFIVLFIDFDCFKLINDTLGHEVGDELLASVGRRLHDRLGREALPARLGGDEFVVLREGVSSAEAARALATDLQGLLGRTHMVGGYEIEPTISVGIVLSDTQRHRRPSEVLRDADLAMYEAKADGGGKAVVFEQMLGEHGLKRMRLARQLRGPAANE